MDEENSADTFDNSPPENAEDERTQNQLREILDRVGYMERVLRDQLSRLYEIETRMGITPPAYRPQARARREPPPPLARPRAPHPPQPPQPEPPRVAPPSSPTSPS